MTPSSVSIHWTRLPNRVPVVGYFWRLFCSVRFALILILMLAGGFFLGVIVSQVSQETALFPQDYADWIETEARPRYGVFTNLLFLLGLFDVFHAVWFRSLLTLLFVAITVCTLNRFPAIYQTTVKAKPVATEGFLRSAKHRAEFDLDGDLASLGKTLKRQGYRLTVTQEPGKTHIYADKFGWAKYLTFVSHLGLLMFLFGGLMTNLVGYQKFMVIPDGMSLPIYPVFHPDQMQVLNQGFTVEYYEDGRPKDYYSDLIIYKGGKEATRGRIRVNSPLDFDGFRFHQNSFGPTVQVHIKNEQTGQVLFSETLVLGRAFGDVPYENVSIPTTNVNAVVALAEGNTTSNVVGGTYIRGGQQPKLAVMGFKGEGGAGGQPDFVVRLNPGETRTEQGLTFTFDGTKFFTGVVARKDPGATLIWIAASMFIPAICLTFWLARRRLWLQITDGHVRLAGMADHFVDLEREIRELVDRVARPPSPETGDPPPAAELVGAVAGR